MLLEPDKVRNSNADVGRDISIARTLLQREHSSPFGNDKNRIGDY